MAKYFSFILFCIVYLSLSLINSNDIYAQATDSIPAKPNAEQKAIHHRYGLWYTPVGRSTVIDGAAIGLVALPVGKGKKPVVNGINIEVNPVPIIAVPIMVMVAINTLTTKHPHKSDTSSGAHLNEPKKDTVIANEKRKFRTVINGLSISPGLMVQEQVNGAALNVIFGGEDEMNGIEVSGLINSHDNFTGVAIAGIANIAKKKGGGVQIGLYNNCKKGKVLQIGLLNKIGKRTIPLINFSFKRSKRD